MSTNAYGVEITPELRAKGDAAKALIEQASKAWNEFAREAMGQEFEDTNTGEYLIDAEDEVTLDLVRLLD